MPPEVEQLGNILRAGHGQEARRFSEPEVDLLSKYYALTLKWNPRLHLTTITEPEEFYERHILESALAESRLTSRITQVWDIGSGLGVPGLVIAILRRNLLVHLVEASRNKGVFLEEAVEALGLSNVKVIASRFESIDALPESSCLTARAVEGMERLLTDLLDLGRDAMQILIFGSKNLEDAVKDSLHADREVKSLLIPGSDRRYLVEILRST
jgi:16S rRNA (guanine527-N7)-methyltransferase